MRVFDVARLLDGRSDDAVAAGTDFMGPELVPHGDNALEMELLVDEIGFSEMDAIQAERASPRARSRGTTSAR